MWQRKQEQQKQGQQYAAPRCRGHDASSAALRSPRHLPSCLQETKALRFMKPRLWLRENHNIVNLILSFS